MGNRTIGTVQGSRFSRKLVHTFSWNLGFLQEMGCPKQSNVLGSRFCLQGVPKFESLKFSLFPKNLGQSFEWHPIYLRLRDDLEIREKLSGVIEWWTEQPNVFRGSRAGFEFLAANFQEGFYHSIEMLSRKIFGFQKIECSRSWKH